MLFRGFFNLFILQFALIKRYVYLFMYSKTFNRCDNISYLNIQNVASFEFYLNCFSICSMKQ